LTIIRLKLILLLEFIGQIKEVNRMVG